MWNRIKDMLVECLDIAAAMLLVGVMVVYVVWTGTVISFVANDFRLDTYIDFTTGMHVVLLIYLLVWVPLAVWKRFEDQ